MNFVKYFTQRWGEMFAFTGRRCPHSAEGEDFLTRRPSFFFTKTAITREHKVEKSSPTWEMNRLSYWWVGWWMWRAGCISQDTFPWQCQVMNGLESNWSLLTHLPATGLPLLIWSFCVCFLFPKIFSFSRTMWLSSILGWSEWNNSKVDGRMHFAFYLPFRNSQIMLTRKQTWKRYDLPLSFRYCNIV